jgi:hypothetical protein
MFGKNFNLVYVLTFTYLHWVAPEIGLSFRPHKIRFF